jgi:hypothetical protein
LPSLNFVSLINELQNKKGTKNGSRENNNIDLKSKDFKSLTIIKTFMH